MLYSLFEKAAARFADKPAIKQEGRSLNYAALDALVCSLAANLTDAGVEPGALVGVCIDSKPETLALYLALARLGARLASLDSAYTQRELAQIFEREGRTTLRNLSVTLEERDRTWTVVGDEGELLSERKHVEIRRNVVVTSSDGLRLETSVLRWDGPRQRLWTDAPVTLSRGRSVVRGGGLEVKMEEEATTVSGRVRATFDLGREP